MTKNATILLGAAVVILITLVAYFFFKGKTPSLPSISIPTSSPQTTLTVKLEELGESKESGEAILKEENGKVVVTLSLVGAPGGITQPAHIHKGSCPGVGEVVYPLSYPIDGRSETKLDTTLGALLTQLPLAINIHKSTQESKVYFACGAIKVP